MRDLQNRNSEAAGVVLLLVGGLEACTVEICGLLASNGAPSLYQVFGSIPKFNISGAVLSRISGYNRPDAF